MVGAIVLSPTDAASQEPVVGSAQRVVEARARAPRDAAVQHCLEYLGSKYLELNRERRPSGYRRLAMSNSVTGINIYIYASYKYIYAWYKYAQWHLNTQHMNREVVNAVKTTATSAVHRAEKVVSGAHSEQKPQNEQKSEYNWHILASRSGSRSARNEQMLRAEMPP